MRSLAPAHAEAQGNINSESSTHTRRAHAKTPTLAMLSHTRARAYRMYFKSLMCKQLLLFAQTTCSFWTQTKLLAYVAVCQHCGAHRGCLAQEKPIHMVQAASDGLALQDGSQLQQNSHTCRRMIFSLRHTHMFLLSWRVSYARPMQTSLGREFKKGDILYYYFFWGVRSVALYLQKDGKKLKEEKKKKRCLLSRSKALGGTITKVIKRVITKSQQESCNATYSISLSYGIYRKYKKTDKQRA